MAVTNIQYMALERDHRLDRRSGRGYVLKLMLRIAQIQLLQKISYQCQSQQPGINIRNGAHSERGIRSLVELSREMLVSRFQLNLNAFISKI